MGYFESAYSGVPPWDIGRPQPEFMRLAEAGEIKGSVLDVGCGTGENALYLASLGHEVWGLDFAPAAIEKARPKARERGLEVTLLVWNVLELQGLKRTFDTVIDSGLFHSLTDAERLLFVHSLTAVLEPGGTYFMLCFSEHEPGSWGPRRVTEAEIRVAFGQGWRINYIRQASFESNLPRGPARAWLSSIARISARVDNES
jgi:cyclopropane fatty-acyl-phospholipid synthase-like methyltransferase